LAYAKELDNRISAVFVYSYVDRQVHQVTPAHADDRAPVFDPAGKYIYFLSRRDFNPVISNYDYFYANTGIDNIFLLVLDENERSPFIPESDEAGPPDKNVEPRDPGHGDDQPVPVKIDFAGIYDRQVAVDLPAGEYTNLAAIDGALFYLSRPLRGVRGRVTQQEQVLHKYDLAEKEDYEWLVDVRDFRLSADGRWIMVHKGDEYYIISTGGKEADLKDSRVALDQIEAWVDYQQEYRQMFDQVWRRQRDFFYDENMHGVDWLAMRERYEKLLPYVADRYDLTYLLGEMVGELCCSHTYVGGGDRPEIPGSEIGLLGVDFEIDYEHDRIRIDRILRGETWSDQLRSPLQAPGIDINAGDYLLAIDGEEITATVNPYSVTHHAADRLITLTVNDEPVFAGAHEVTVRPIASEEALRYHDWVEARRLHVDSVSNGQIGYLHIPDMSGWGLVRFEKMYYHQLRKPALIVDVRYNGGGWVSSLILDRLRKTVVAMGSSRTFAHGPVPGSGLHNHMITLQNEFSCSDGDYFPYFFREYGLGPLMGVRTWGGVIGIEGMDRLIDGGYYTVPQFGIYSFDGEWIMENVGVEPDIEVRNSPDRMARGYDDQLDRAIEYLQQKLAEDPKTFPLAPGPPEER
jgi:tricorn protease